MFKGIAKYLRPSEAQALRDLFAEFCSDRIKEINLSNEGIDFDAIEAAAAFHKIYSRLNELISDLG